MNTQAQLPLNEILAKKDLRALEKIKSSSLQHPLTNRGVSCPNLVHKTEFERKQSEKRSFVVSWDWVEFTAQIIDCELQYEIPVTQSFDINPSQKRSAYYHFLHDVKIIENNQHIDFATISILPRVSFIPKNIVQVKIANSFCYHHDLVNLIQKLLFELNLTFKNYIRLDWAMDFQECKCYYNPQILMQKFINNELSVNYKKNMSADWNNKVLNTLTFGSKSTSNSIILYNKSNEMKAISDKPYIRQLWTEIGFDNRDVYRLEMSNRKDLKTLTNINGITKIGFEDVLFLKTLNEYYKSQYHQYFKVKNNALSTKNKPIFKTLFNIDENGFYALTPLTHTKSNNYNKSYIKKTIIDAIFYEKEKDYYTSSLLFEHVQNKVNQYGLKQWYNEKILPHFDTKTTKTVFEALTSSQTKLKPFIQSQIHFSNLEYCYEFINKFTTIQVYKTDLTQAIEYYNSITQEPIINIRYNQLN